MNRQKRFCEIFRFCEKIREKPVSADIISTSMTTLAQRKLFYFGKSKKLKLKVTKNLVSLKIDCPLSTYVVVNYANTVSA